MPPSKDSRSYCAKCKHRKTCKTPCYPVEHLLSTLTSSSVKPPAWYVEFVRGSTSMFPAVPNWERKSTKQKVFELCFIDRCTQHDAACIIGCSQPRVARLVKDIMYYFHTNEPQDTK